MISKAYGRALKPFSKYQCFNLRTLKTLQCFSPRSALSPSIHLGNIHLGDQLYIAVNPKTLVATMELTLKAPKSRLQQATFINIFSLFFRENKT